MYIMAQEINKGQVFLLSCYFGQKRTYMLRGEEKLLAILSSKQADFDYCIGNVSIFNRVMEV